MCFHHKVSMWYSRLKWQQAWGSAGFQTQYFFSSNWFRFRFSVFCSSNTLLHIHSQLIFSFSRIRFSSLLNHSQLVFGFGSDSIIIRFKWFNVLFQTNTSFFFCQCPFFWQHLHHSLPVVSFWSFLYFKLYLLFPSQLESNFDLKMVSSLQELRWKWILWVSRSWKTSCALLTPECSWCGSKQRRCHGSSATFIPYLG